MQAAVAIGRFAYRPALEPLLTLLADDDASVCTFASQYAFRTLGEVALPHLLQAVTDGRSSVRAGATMALGTLITLDALWDVPEHIQRDLYPYALSDENRTQAVNALMIAALDGDLDVRLAALDGLSRHGDPRAADVLLPALADTDPNIRAGAVEGIHQCGLREAVPLLLTMLRKDDSQAVRFGILATLGDLAGSRAQVRRTLNAVRDHDGDGAVRAEAARVLTGLQRGRT